MNQLAKAPLAESVAMEFQASARCQTVPNFPRLRALALFGRRPPQRADSHVMPATENQHKLRH
jgi:hypothetical protein